MRLRHCKILLAWKVLTNFGVSLYDWLQCSVGRHHLAEVVVPVHKLGSDPLTPLLLHHVLERELGLLWLRRPIAHPGDCLLGDCPSRIISESPGRVEATLGNSVSVNSQSLGVGGQSLSGLYQMVSGLHLFV